jgi:hypothetical protein
MPFAVSIVPTIARPWVLPTNTSTSTVDLVLVLVKVVSVKSGVVRVAGV